MQGQIFIGVLLGPNGYDPSHTYTPPHDLSHTYAPAHVRATRTAPSMRRHLCLGVSREVDDVHVVLEDVQVEVDDVQIEIDPLPVREASCGPPGWLCVCVCLSVCV